MTLLRLQYIDQAVAKIDHRHLRPQHKCYFLREYTSGQNYNFGETNQLIINLKKSMSRQGRPEWRYKEKAIHQIAEELSAVVPDDYFERTAFVPVPPSKARSDPKYDPRLIQILELMNGQRGGKVTISDSVSRTVSREALHLGEGQRPTPEEQLKTLALNHSTLPQACNRFAVFDDIITTGSSYVAMHNLLQRARPDAVIFGLFVARRVFPPPTRHSANIDLAKLFEWIDGD